MAKRNNPPIPWTDEEVSRLRNIALVFSTRDAANVLNRSLASVRSKWKRERRRMVEPQPSTFTLTLTLMALSFLAVVGLALTLLMR